MNPIPTAVTDSTEFGSMMLTDVAIRKAVKSQQPQRLTEGAGRGTGRLLLMIRPGCAPEWYAQRFENGRKRLTKLGNYPGLTLADARELYRSGEWKPVERPAGVSVAELFNDYCDALQAAGKRSAEDMRRTLERVAELIGKDKPACQVTAADVVAAIRPVYKRGKASMADHMRSHVRSAYGWAASMESDYRADSERKYLITGNPAADIPTEQKVAGERWLSVDELRLFWHWLARGGDERNPNRNINPLAYVALQLIAVTGQRVEEICRIDRSMANWRLMTIEWPKTKMKRPHVLPMSTQVAILLERTTPSDSGLFLPSVWNGCSPMSDVTLRTVIGRFCVQQGVPHFTTRDLRRTWKTLAGEAGVSKEDRDRLQNHSSGDVASVHYDRYSYLREKRAAVLQWGTWFERTIEKAR